MFHFKGRWKQLVSENVFLAMQEFVFRIEFKHAMAVVVKRLYSLIFLIFS